jgi:regulator of sirC expression with transglutaminase-like and TPR domain
MGGPLNLEAPTALDYFATLVAEDDGFPLVEAAASVAQDEHDNLDPQGVLATIDALADQLRRRIPADAAPLQRLRLLHAYFFQELGFAGNVNDYYDPRNSYLHEVLASRRGIPITLALLFAELANQVGLRAHGVSFPGHFLVKLAMPRGEVVLDPCTGHSLSRDQLHERLMPYLRQMPRFEDEDTTLSLVLQAAPARDVVARLLRNLKEIHRQAADWPRLAAVQSRLVILLPQAWEERRDRGLALAQLGRTELAAADLERYLAEMPQAPDAPALRRQLGQWQQPGGLH